MSGYLLDTHIFLWWLKDNLPFAEVSKLEQLKLTHTLYLSVVSCWEIAMLVHNGKVKLHLPCRQWVMQALEKSTIRIVEFNFDIAMEAYALPGDFHKDPADRFLVACARLNDLTLVTHDQKIRDYAKAGYVSVLDA